MKKNEILSISAIIISSISLLISLILIIIVASNGTNSSQNNNKYDVSMMHKVTTTELASMFENKESFVLFIGRDECEGCRNIAPVLEEMQIKNNYITQYLDITEIDRTTSTWKKIAEALDMKTSAELSDGISVETIEDTFGNFATEYGFTPLVAIIKNGVQKDGFIGYKSLYEMEKIYNK